MQLLVTPDGAVRCIYSEAIDLAQLGRPAIARASHVEPDEQGRWFADLTPVDGPRLGPFARRSDALAQETSWLEAHWLVCPLASPPASDVTTRHPLERANPV
ncbi:MAG: hypothetical protein JW741_03835 [Sedimentisphaerales bacterium]|nr:hypothetical protein [Sedimentisphaerales bacterium]